MYSVDQAGTSLRVGTNHRLGERGIAPDPSVHGHEERTRSRREYTTTIFGASTKRMRTKDINTVIEQFDALPLEEKELAAGIIRKAYAEAARDELAKRVKTAVRNEKAGKVRKGNVSDLLKDLEP